MKTMSAILSLILTLSTTLAYAQGGAMGGGGGDLKTLDPGDAWFVGAEKSISACVVVDPSFVKNKEEVKTQITAAYARWEQYIKEKLSRRAPEHTPSTTVVFTDDCGSADLTFYMGVDNDEVRQAKKQYQDPIAFVHRKSKSREWGKGFVWFKSAPYWNYPDTLYGMLLHESGHILGNDHASGTIMDENYAERIASAYSTYGPGPNGIATRIERTEIDQRAQLVNGSTHFTGIISQFTRGIPDYDQSNPQALEGFMTGHQTFKRLMGRDGKGDIYTHLEIPSLPLAVDDGTSTVTLPFSLEDDLGSITFSIQIIKPMTVDLLTIFGVTTPKAFHVNTPQTFFPIYSPAAHPYNLIGKMQTPEGEWVVQIELNTDGPVRVMYVDGLKSYELMRTRFVTDTKEAWAPYSQTR